MTNRDQRGPASLAEDDDRLISFAELHTLVGLARSTIDELEKAGQFPRRKALTPRRVAWRLADVRAWTRTLPIASAFDQQTAA